MIKNHQVRPRKFYCDNECDNTNCLFNHNYLCLCYRNERRKPLTKDKECSEQMLEKSDLKRIKSYFKKNAYVVKRELVFGRRDIQLDHFKYIVSIIKLKNYKQIFVNCYLPRTKIKTTLFLKDLFYYELLRRNKEWEEESLALNNYAV